MPEYLLFMVHFGVTHDVHVDGQLLLIFRRTQPLIKLLFQSNMWLNLTNASLSTRIPTHSSILVAPMTST